jgi:hypothetical protein
MFGVGIHFEEADAGLEISGLPFERRRLDFAQLAPRGPEIDDHWDLVFLHMLLQALLRNRYCTACKDCFLAPAALSPASRFRIWDAICNVTVGANNVAGDSVRH